jgi:putative transposase
MDYEGIKTLLEGADKAFPRLRHLWLEAGYRAEDKGTRIGWKRPWAGAWISGGACPKARPRGGADSVGQGVGKRGPLWVDWQKLLPPRGFVVLPRRWVVERTIAWIEHNRRMSKDYERLAATSEAFIYVAMSRLSIRRLMARS